MRDTDEEVGLDFTNFYFLMRCIQATKQYGKTKYGSMLQEEWYDLLKEHEMFNFAKKYVDGSFVMTGDYTLGKDYTVESEAYYLSNGYVQPMQYRFK